jgi:hypothetical protein
MSFALAEDDEQHATAYANPRLLPELHQMKRGSVES